MLKNKILLPTLFLTILLLLSGCDSKNPKSETAKVKETGNETYEDLKDYYEEVEMKDIDKSKIGENTTVLQLYRLDLSKEGIKELITSTDEESIYNNGNAEILINKGEIIKYTVDESKELPETIREENEESKLFYYEIIYYFEILKEDALKDKDSFEATLEINNEITYPTSLEFEDENLSKGKMIFRTSEENFEVGGLIISIDDKTQTIDYKIQ